MTNEIDFQTSDVSLNDLKAVFPTARRQLILCGENGRRAVVDFGGEAVTYSGELPVDEAARVFFEAVSQYIRTEET